MIIVRFRCELGNQMLQYAFCEFLNDMKKKDESGQYGRL